MKRSITSLICVSLVLAASFLFSADKPPAKAKPDFTTTDPNAPVPSYELRVGDKTYDVLPDVPVEIVTPAGEHLTVVLHPKDVGHYAAAGVSFDYPRAMTPTVKKSRDSTTVTLRGELNVVAMVQVYTIDAPDQIEGLLIDGFNKVLGAPGNPSTPTPVSRSIGGAPRAGKLLKFPAKNLQTELYVFSRAGTTLAVVFQCPTAKLEAVKPGFDLIAGSLK